MAITDPIADMLTRIRNGLQAGLTRVDVPGSNLKQEIARVLGYRYYQAAVNFSIKCFLELGIMKYL